LQLRCEQFIFNCTEIPP